MDPREVIVHVKQPNHRDVVLELFAECTFVSLVKRRIFQINHYPLALVCFLLRSRQRDGGTRQRLVSYWIVGNRKHTTFSGHEYDTYCIYYAEVFTGFEGCCF